MLAAIVDRLNRDEVGLIVAVTISHRPLRSEVESSRPRRHRHGRITQLFLKDDPHIGRDAVFADQTSLQADFVHHDPGLAPDGTMVEEPFVTLEWTFTLAANTTSKE
ncbi:hypothetical protein MYCO108962_16485 [Mycobacterium colombiense]|uniref:Catechol 1,2-dioxygenase n=1 Tax=Mycobacterium colombiense CECT 3035 TaxID=1041522 RepID=J4JVY4_9MYCO|nr:hypothetical protein [Mycobacterium colombiense]EJO89842.1 catechol 1,2-dioxygenase [Mycobacterium colombiense CECT 3035]